MYLSITGCFCVFVYLSITECFCVFVYYRVTLVAPWFVTPPPVVVIPSGPWPVSRPGAVLAVPPPHPLSTSVCPPSDSGLPTRLESNTRE